MNEPNNFELVPRPPGALAKAEPGAERLLSDMVPALAVTHLGFCSTPATAPILSLRLPSLTHLSCGELGLTELDLSGVPMVTELWCFGNGLRNLDVRPLPQLERLL